MKHLVLVFITCVLNFLVFTMSHAIAATPPTSFTSSQLPPISIEQADRVLRAARRGEKAQYTTLQTSQIASPRRTTQISAAVAAGPSCTAASTQPTEIMTLAAALKCDPDLIFEYVYNNIEFEPLFGSNKGALGTLLDQRGDDIDQAQLLAALLSAAGFGSAQIQFEYGYIRLTGQNAASWLGVINDCAEIQNLLSGGGIPTANAFCGTSPTLDSIDVAHVWLNVQISGNFYAFDPSYKLHNTASVSANLASILGYSRSQFLSDAGGTVTGISITGVNRANVRSDLATYASNLASYIKSNGPSWSLMNIVGGKSVVPLTGSPIRQVTLPNLSPSQPSGYPQNWGATVPNSYRTCLTISMPGVAQSSCADPSSQTIQLYSDQTYGQRITLFSVANGSSFIPTLLINGAAPPNGQNTGTALPAGQLWAVNVAIMHAAANNPGANQAGPLDITSGGSYLISAGWGQVGRGMVNKHRSLLAQAQASGASNGSEAVLGETLAVISYSWLAENASAQRLLNTINSSTLQYYHGLGITAQTAIQGQSGTQGPYVDLPLNFVQFTAQSSQAGTGLAPLFIGTAATESGFSSAFESAVLQQTQGLIPNMTAASTMVLIDQNVASGSAAVTYFADGTTSSGLSNYFTSIRPNIVANYLGSDVLDIDKEISSNGLSTGSPTGNQVLLPGNGKQNIGSWQGAGYTILNEQSSGSEVAFGITQRITGGLSGGFSGTDVPVEPPVGTNDPTVVSSTTVTTQPPAVTSSIPAAATNQPSAIGNPTIAEPVDGVTGAYIYDHSDITLGSGPLPYSLSFGRSYSSASNLTDIGLGKGWTNSASIAALRTSDPYPALGEQSAMDAIASIAALYVSQDLLAQPLGAQNVTLAWLVNRWLTDQTISNAVLILQPSTDAEYLAPVRSDGVSSLTYVPPMGDATVLTGTTPDSSGGMTVFNMLTKDQTKITFNPIDATNTGQIASYARPNGIGESFSYGYSANGINYLTRVSNTLSRVITLNWTLPPGATQPHLNSVSDGNGRATGYSYDGSGNLISFKDPLGNLTQYQYDGAGRLTQIIYPAHPANAFVVNSYDGLGRINGQANANGYNTLFYFAGSRTETVDPLGNRHVTYQTPRGKVLSDTSVLSNSFGDVFNDTPQQSGLMVTSHQYDGQDRVTLTTAPELGTTVYTYSPDFEQNLIQTTLTPKPGSTLGPLTTTYAYDPLYNKMTQLTDPLGLVTTMSYDPATGNLLKIVRDSGTRPHINQTSLFTYNTLGQPLTSTDPRGTLTTYSYDGSGNLITVIRDAYGAAASSQTGYDATGNAISQTDPNRNTTTLTYDANRQVLTTTSPATVTLAPTVTANSFDPDGNIIQVQQSASGMVLRTTAATYSNTDKVLTSIDANGYVSKLAYDQLDRLISVTDPVGRVTAYGYDAMSRQISISNPAIQAAPLQLVQFTPDGLVGSLTDALGNVLSSNYDGFDRLASLSYPAAGSQPATSESYTYDADGNTQSHTTRRGDTISFNYDTLNRLTTKTEPAGTPSVTFAYDAVNHVTSVSDNSASIPAVTGSGSLTVTTSYDARNEPVSLSWTPAAAQTAPTPASVTFTHAYDATNRRIQQVANDNSWIAYPTATGTTSYTANTLNQYTAVGGSSPTYDANGNLTFDGSFTYSYDAESRLVSIAQGGTQLANYPYDGQGRRKSRTAGGVTTITITGAEDQDIAEYDASSGALTALYAYNPAGGVDAVLSRVVPGGARQTLVPDIQGSVIASLDSGGTLSRVSYQSYGESTTAPSSGAGLRYTARRLDPETAIAGGAQPSGLYYNRARMYSPTLGRFLQPDPIGIQGGINLYAYVNNDPLNLTDPFGLAADGGGGNGTLGLFGLGLTAVCAAAEPCGAVEVGGIAALGLGAALLNQSQQTQALNREQQNPDYTYQTYTRINPTTGQVYVGRTSGPGDPLTNVANRYSGSTSLPGFGPAQLDQSSTSYSAIRGREQNLIDAYGGVASPNVANRINGISPFNPLGPYYLYRSQAEFGPAIPR